MKINNDILEKEISDYQIVIKNPRNWKLFRNFVIIQRDIKLKQAKLMSKKVTIPSIKNIEQKLCFSMYLVFEFPEITERLRRSLRLQKHITKIAEEIPPSSDNQTQYDKHRSIIMGELSKLFDSYEGNHQNFLNEKDSLRNQPSPFGLTPLKESFLLFMERFHMAIPQGTEWEFLLSNNILTMSNILLIQQAYDRGESNIEKTHIIFEKNWNHFFQSLEEYVKYVIDNQIYSYVFTSMFIECAHQFKKETELVSKYQEGALISLSKLVQNDSFLNLFVDPIISKMYMATDEGQFARYKAKIFELKQFGIKDNSSFANLFNYLIRRNLRIMQKNPEDNKLYSLLINTCRYNNSLLKIFHIPDSVDEYVDDRKVNKAMWKVGPIAQFVDENQKNIAVFTARIVELKYWISVIKEKEASYEYQDHLNKLRNATLLLNYYVLPDISNNNYVYMKKSTIGSLMQKCLQNLGGQSNMMYNNPVLEALESLALMIFYTENQESKDKPGDENNIDFIINKLTFPRIVINLLRAKEELIPENEYLTKINNLVFLGESQDAHLKELVNIQNKKISKKKTKILRQSANEKILKACHYLFENIKLPINKKEPYMAIGETKGTKTKIFFEQINNKSSIKNFTQKYNKIFKQNKDKFQVFIVVIGDDSAKMFAEKIISMRQAGSERIIFISIGEIIKESLQ